jgi:hypothetical protein
LGKSEISCSYQEMNDSLVFQPSHQVTIDCAGLDLSGGLTDIIFI